MTNAKELLEEFTARSFRDPMAVNLVEVAIGVFPNGLADYKVPSEHKA